MFRNEDWWKYLNDTCKLLIEQSFVLLRQAKKGDFRFKDYSFVLMPAAKAYEGFLKDLLVDLDLAGKEVVQSKRFRIGKSLNPELEHVSRLRKECLFDELSGRCGRETALSLWETWKKCRNRVFHYFPDERLVFSLSEVEERLGMVVETIGKCYKECLMEKAGGDLLNRRDK